KAKRRLALWQAGLFALGMIVPSIVGWLDMSLLARPYYLALRSQFYQEMALLAVVVIGGAVLVGLAWRTRVLTKLERSTWSWLPAASALMVFIIVLVLASMPLWRHGHRMNGARNFAELAAYWPSWYVGGLVAALGVAGVALATARATRKRQL